MTAVSCIYVCPRLHRAWLDDVDNQRELYFVWTVVVLGGCIHCKMPSNERFLDHSFPSVFTSIGIHVNLYCEKYMKFHGEQLVILNVLCNLMFDCCCECKG